MKHQPCTCQHMRADHGFTVGKVGCFVPSCDCIGIPEVSHETPMPGL